MFKWFKKKLRFGFRPQLSALGAEIMEALQNPEEWEADEWTLYHKQSGLQLWVANKDEKGASFHICRIPAALANPLKLAMLQEEAKRMLSAYDTQTLAPVAYALQEKLNGTLTDATLNALRLARQTTEI